MNSQQVELWAREIIAAVLSNQPVEDSRVELKSSWIPADKAAPRLAGHANSSRGTPILWLVGVDEKNRALVDADPKERENWYASVQKCFDGFAPRLAVDVNIRINNCTVVALYFETHREAPYVIKNSQGGFPEFIVPWREGTRLRAARRDELLRILISKKTFVSILDELDFNKTLASQLTGPASMGCPFQVEEFDRAMSDSLIGGLPAEVKELVHQAYIAMKRANQCQLGAMNADAIGSRDKRNQAWSAVRDAAPKITDAYNAFQKFLKE